MQTLVHHCKYNHSSSPLNSFDSLHHRTLAKTQSFCTPFLCCTTRISIFSKNSLRALRRNTQFSFCSKNDTLDGLSSATQNEVAIEDDSLAKENAELGLLDKPFPMPRDEVEEPGLEVSEEVRAESVNEDEALAPFLKFFNQTTETDEAAENEPSRERVVLDLEYEVENRVGVEYYDPKAGDFAVGVVVSGNENKLDVHVGADLLGTMLTKEVLPLYAKEIEFLRCDPGSEAGDFPYAPGRMGVVGYGGESEPVDGRPVVEPGTVLFVEVLGRTLSGRPLLSCRRLFRRISWHRLRQIQQLNEPIEVRITEWNTGGLLTRLEGLRAFIPKAELMKRINNFSELKEKVGSPMRVLITRINDEKNDLILSEKEAWQMTNLREGALLEGAVRKVFPYGVQIRIGETNRSGLLHISNISKVKISSVNDVFAVGDKVKVLVVKSMFPDKISLSIADLESEPGLFISDKERVFSEAEMMAKKFRAKLPGNMTTERSKSGPTSALAFENEGEMYANWKWFKFERDIKQADS